MLNSGSRFNQILGNYIGVTASGAQKLPNTVIGVVVIALVGRSDYASDNIIGGQASGSSNVISGNTVAGVYLQGDRNLVMGNFIGMAPGGASSLGNTGHGVVITNGSQNEIGELLAGEGNVISGNSGDGVYIANSLSRSNVVVGNPSG